MTRNVAPVLEWGIKESFLAYVDALSDSRRETEGVDTREGVFVFPGRAAGTLEFTGRIRLTGHGGALDVTLADPAIERDAQGLVLTADTGGGRLVLARLLDSPPEAGLLTTGGGASDVALTLDGAGWLGAVYHPWTRVDPVRVRVAPVSAATRADPSSR